MSLPLCVVMAPFGTKPDGRGGTIDFDLVYRNLLAPAIAQAGLQPVRLDDDVGAGQIPQMVLERMMDADLAVFDLTTAQPGVLYQLGVRHALRPRGTIAIAARGAALPFDLASVRVLSYALSTSGRPEDAAAFQHRFKSLVAAERLQIVDSPVYQALPQLAAPVWRGVDAQQAGVPGPAVAGGLALSAAAPSRTPAAKVAADAEAQKHQIQQARRLGADELHEVELSLGDIGQAAPEVALTLFDAYRGVGAWQRLVDLAGRLPASVAGSTRVQEQLALALNRVGDWQRAERIVLDLLQTQGRSSETFGLLGRIYKDRWQQALASQDLGRAAQALVSQDLGDAARYLDQAIEAYLRGFETDWRDPYPGVNAVTLMAQRDTADPRLDEILPVVIFATKQKLANGSSDYWDLATMLELQVLAGHATQAQALVQQLHDSHPDAWQIETTARNLRLLRDAAQRRGTPGDWIDSLIAQLTPAARP